MSILKCASGSEEILSRLPAGGFPCPLLFQPGDFGSQKIDTAAQFVHRKKAEIAADLVRYRLLRTVIVKEAHMPAPFST
jgi:hypothetical protein